MCVFIGHGAGWPCSGATRWRRLAAADGGGLQSLLRLKVSLAGSLVSFPPPAGLSSAHLAGVCSCVPCCVDSLADMILRPERDEADRMIIYRVLGLLGYSATVLMSLNHSIIDDFSRQEQISLVEDEMSQIAFGN